MGDIHNESKGPVYGPSIQAGRIGQINITVAPTTALAGLPPGDGEFVGRQSELALLAAVLCPDTGDSRPLAVSAIAGLPGVGKTALAVKAARNAVNAGWFPRGVLFLDLEGYARSGPVEPFAALSTLLHALGVPGADVPPDRGGREVLYRSRLAERAEAVLIVLDNASSSDQVRPLLPGGLPHKVLVTSRHTLADLGARQCDLDVLTEVEAGSVVESAVRTAFPDDERPDAGEVAELVRICGRLPLALRIVGAILVRDRDRTVRDLVRSLEDETTRLTKIAYGRNLQVRAALDLSYRLLDREESRLLRYVSLDPGQDFSVEAAAALVKVPVSRAEETLRSLRNAHMLLGGDRPGRYRMHDIVRLYAREKFETSRAGVSHRSTRRLCDYYRGAAVSAVSWLDTATLASPDRSRFPEQRDAITWLGNERGNLLGVIAIAEERQYHACVEDIARALVAFFINDGRADECLPLCERVLDSAQRRKATGSQGNFLGFLGWALREQGRTEDATRCFASALELFRRCGSPEQEGCALGWLGLAAAAAGDFDRAREHYLRALDIHREWHDAHGEGTTLVNLGEVEGKRGCHGAARESFARALAIFRGGRDRYGEAETLIHMGQMAFAAGDGESGRRHHEEAVGIFEDLGLRHRAADALVELGVMICAARPLEAREYWDRAMDIAARYGDPQVAKTFSTRLMRLRGGA